MEHIKRLIMQSRLDEALQELHKALPAHLKGDAILLINQQNDLKSKDRRGILSSSELNLGRNKITAKALELCESPIADSEGGMGDGGGSSDSNKTQILFLAADPTDQTRLQTDREFATIRERMQQSRDRHRFGFLIPEISLKVENLVQAMNQGPEIVHFSGHGLEKGIIITNDQNESEGMPTRALKRLFRQHKEDLKLVILNSCYSAVQAEAISGLGVYVIGMNAPVGDLAAISFAGGIYLGLGAGKSVEKAFDDAMIVIETKHPKFADLPEVWKDGKKLDL